MSGSQLLPSFSFSSILTGSSQVIPGRFIIRLHDDNTNFNIQEQISTAQRRYTLEMQVESQRLQLRELLNSLQSLQGVFTTLKHQHGLQIQNLRQINAEQNQTIANLQQMIANQNQTIANLQQSLNEERLFNRNLSNTLNSLVVRIGQLEARDKR